MCVFGGSTARTEFGASCCFRHPLGGLGRVQGSVDLFLKKVGQGVQGDKGRDQNSADVCVFWGTESQGPGAAGTQALGCPEEASGSCFVTCLL